ncbi:NfeD family protein [Thiotrichales bacterium 19S3-7]|nr:NfeD family protein [Thiotrichales bacterium 19S3-7]MCF6802498.1 NfeD family protein [Thiotrichales bacterium 19S3-11]
MIFWHWLILGGVFLIIELLSFTAFFLFFGIASVVMAVITWLHPGLDTWSQVIIAAILAVISCLIWYKIYRSYKKSKQNKDALNLNVRLSQYIGKEATLLTDVTNGYAKAKIGDTQWRVEITESLKSGDKVVITAFDSTTLKAKSLDKDIQNNQ